MIKQGMLENKRIMTLRNQSEVTLHGLEPGGAVAIEVDSDGTPLDENWRRRLKDSEIDNCVTVTPEPKLTSKPKKQERNNG